MKNSRTNSSVTAGGTTKAPHQTVAWIGPGKMGLAMLSHLLKAGHPVIVCGSDPQSASVARARALGAQVAATAAAAAAAADVVVSSVPNDSALRAVALGDDGVLAHVRPGGIYIDTSTVSAATSAEVAAQAQARGVHYLRAPVSGSTTTAEAAMLTSMISGSHEAYEQVRPLIERWGKTHFYLGAAEEARHMKLLLNLMVSVSAGMLGEALTLGRANGLRWQEMLDVIEASAVASPLVKYKTPTLRTRDFRAAFTSTGVLKDLGLILASGQQTGTYLPLTQSVHDLYAGIVQRGQGDLDLTAAIPAVEHASGVHNEPDLTRAS